MIKIAKTTVETIKATYSDIVAHMYYTKKFPNLITILGTYKNTKKLFRRFN